MGNRDRYPTEVRHRAVRHQEESDIARHILVVEGISPIAVEGEDALRKAGTGIRVLDGDTIRREVAVADYSRASMIRKTRSPMSVLRSIPLFSIASRHAISLVQRW